MSILSRFSADPKAKFAKQVLAEVNRQRVAEAWIKSGDFAIGYRRTSGEEAGWIYLNNVYLECQGLEKAAVRVRIERLVQAVLHSPQVPTTWEGVRANLRPVIRAVTFGLVTGDKRMLSRPLLPFLSEFAVIDTPTAMAYVQERHLGEWGVSATEVFEQARANIAALSAPPEEKSEPRLIRFVDDGDAYFVSRLLVPGWLASFATPFGGRPIAFMPSGNTLLIATTPEENLPALLTMVEEDYNSAPRSISPQAYTVSPSGDLIEYPAELGHPKEIHRAGTLLAAAEYAAQKHWLEQEHEREGVDIFVASYAVMQRPDESLFSLATWGEGVDSLLPKTDYVAFASEHDRFFVEWEVVAGLTSLTVTPGYAPSRYRVTQWPERPILELLKRRAVSP